MGKISLKSMVFSGGGRLLRNPPLRFLTNRHFRPLASVIFYHAVWQAGDDRGRLFGGMDRDRFAQEMRQLSRVFRFVGIPELLDHLASGHWSAEGDDRPVLAVTFDDGFDLTAGGATDVMDELGIPGTVFINTNSVRQERLMWQHRITAIHAERGLDVLTREIAKIQQKLGSDARMTVLRDQAMVTRTWPMPQKESLIDELWSACDMPEMKTMLDELKPYMTWDGLRAWMERGHHVGFHTRSHPFCSLLDEAGMQRELIDPVAEVKAELSLENLAFAYPFGDRLQPELEKKLAAMGVFSGLLGTAGFSRWGTDPAAFNRIEAEAGVDTEVFGKPILRALLGRG